MAKKTKKARVTKRGTRSAKGRKVSKARQMRASNSCCPIIQTVCSPTYMNKKETIMGDDTVINRVVKVKGPNKCRVKMGGEVYEDLTTEQMDAKVKELSTALNAKRCQAVVVDYHKAKAEKATSKLLKHMYSAPSAR